MQRASRSVSLSAKEIDQMGIDEAIRILMGKRGSVADLGPEYLQYARAGETYVRHHTRDARPQRKQGTRDQGQEAVLGATRMGSDPGSGTGPDEVARLAA
jgi:hypothetical protein